MSEDTRPYRSVLYIPGSKQRALDKARSLPVDAIILDLEDAVAPEAKPAARKTLATALGEGGYGNRVQIVRINGLETPWWQDDIAALADSDLDAILLPKVNSPEDIQRLVDALASPVSVWAMLENALGYFERAFHCGASAHGWFCSGDQRSGQRTELPLSCRSVAVADGIANCTFGCPGRGGDCD